MHPDLFVPGTELSELTFSNFFDWFIHISDISIHWKYEPTYIISQFAVLVGALATIIHAFNRGGRLPYLWFSIIIYGLAIESISYVHPDVDNFWHSQTPIIFLGRRLPLHIILLYPCLLYQSSVSAAKMRLPKWSEPLAVGLLVILIDIPYDIVSVRFMHWTWHDTDPNIFDRHYFVPWNSYFFHSTFAASFTFWFHFLKEKLCTNDGKWIADKRISRELLCAILAGPLGILGGILIFMAIYHPLHDIYKIHSEVTFFTIFSILLVLIWASDRQPRNVGDAKEIPHKTHWTTWILIVHLTLHFFTYLGITMFFNPENEISTGIKEKLGPCDEYAYVRSPLGMLLSKRKYLCPTDYDEKYFDWSCLPEKEHPSLGSLWYTICGVPFTNRPEYILIISLICGLAAVIFYNLHFSSGGDSVFNYKFTKYKTNVLKKTK